MADHDERLWTVADVAAYLQVSRNWVYDHAGRGELPHVRFGGHVRFKPAAIRVYVERGIHGVATVVPIRSGRNDR